MTLPESDALDHFTKARGAHGDLQQALHNELILQHRDLADSVAAAYAGQGRDRADLRQVAYIGLIKAVRRFDPAIGRRFPAFAVPTIHGEIKRYLRDLSWMVRPPREVQDLRTTVAKVYPSLTQRLAREPSLPELARELGQTEKIVSEALTCHSSLQPDSLDAPFQGGFLADVHGSIDGRLEQAENLVVLAEAIRTLDDGEKDLLCRRYFHEEPQQVIGERLGMTQMQVSRRLAKILVKLQHEILGRPAPAKAAAVARAQAGAAVGAQTASA
ncbi:sigma-70 family RNA polymerase sigma factor [Arthrobacter sp. ATA002]|uniref:sigma-70 family RNA polymerase sigma factor n=1 Tax=Arthrobacter sp. ATA002 TaxID=2991715 RepID=UPI0022A7E0E1|nr:sigma-70 family RNA polymerase sigma factor [Arthrobacter sp. ATA002]WAP52030.1 sigma-70 family RNA polymerase sigma factor [Arthrobacter sp. ATA002]